MMEKSKIDNKVVTITLNPALDLTGSLDSINVGSLNLVNKGSLHAAGKGVNVAKVLSDLGAEVTVTGFLGRDNELLFCQLFEQMNACDRFIREEGGTRTNVKLVEENGRVSEINFPGIEISKQAIDKFEVCLFELAKTHKYFVLAGSLPKGISPKLCASWIDKLQKMGKKVIFDSSGAALVTGISARPWMIKPNEEELSDLTERNLKSNEDYQHVAQQLFNEGIENIVVSLGEKGVLWLGKYELGTTSWRYAQPPKMKVVSTVGAGDTLVAGFCWGHMQQWKVDKLLSFSTALSALAVSQVGVGITDINELTELQKEINVVGKRFEE